MSELKGTILGIVLTLILFATLSTVLTVSFNKMGSGIESRVNEIVSSE